MISMINTMAPQVFSIVLGILRAVGSNERPLG